MFYVLCVRMLYMFFYRICLYVQVSDLRVRVRVARTHSLPVRVLGYVID